MSACACTNHTGERSRTAPATKDNSPYRPGNVAAIRVTLRASAKHIKGKTPPFMFARTAFSASHYEQITGVTIGEQCGATAAMTTFFDSSAPTTDA